TPSAQMSSTLRGRLRACSARNACSWGWTGAAAGGGSLETGSGELVPSDRAAVDSSLMVRFRVRRDGESKDARHARGKPRGLSFAGVQASAWGVSRSWWSDVTRIRLQSDY